MSKTAVIYHARCADGTTSAAVAKLFLDREGHDVDYHPASYPWPLPEGFEDCYKRIYILDFSLSAGDMLRLRTKQNYGLQLVWIDHHASAIQESLGEDVLSEDGPGYTERAHRYDDLPGIRRDGTAGCALTWEWFSRGEKWTLTSSPTFIDEVERYRVDPVNDAVAEIPPFVRLVALRDVWGNPLGSGNMPEEAHFLHAGCTELDYNDIAAWAELVSGSRDRHRVIEIGRALDQSRQAAIANIMKDPSRVQRGKFAGRDAVFVSLYGPDGRQADAVSDAHPGRLQVWHASRFVGGDLHANLSFRSRGQSHHCGEIAAELKERVEAECAGARNVRGGGHEGAAGCNVPMGFFWSLVELES